MFAFPKRFLQRSSELHQPDPAGNECFARSQKEGQGARALWVLLCASTVMATPHAIAQANTSSASSTLIQGAQTGDLVVPGEFNGDLRTLATTRPAAASATVNINPRPKRNRPFPTFPRPAPKLDPLLESPNTLPQKASSSPLASPADSVVSSFNTPLRNFEGQGYSGASNPDTIGDVGPKHYIQMINGAAGASFKIFDKVGGVLVLDTRLGSLAPAGARCAGGTGDPIVLYDPLADRWLMSEVANRVVGQLDRLCVYISKTANPVTGGWWTYEFATPGFPDYPHYAVWPDAYYVGVNEVEAPEPGGSFASAYALDRKKMLKGQAAGFNRFIAPQLPGFASFNEMTPADLDGKTPPPAGAPGYFVRHVDDEFHFGATTPIKDYLEMWALHADFANPANATFTRLPNVPIADFDSRICDDGAGECIKQPNPAQKLDALREMTMWRVQYRNFFGIESLVGNFTVDANGLDKAGIRWFALNKIGPSNWFLTQQGTYSPDGSSRWMGSIAMDGCGNIALGYSVSSETVYPGIRYAGRMLLDPPGKLPRGENSIIEGQSSYLDFNRWGDYSSMNVDPADDSTFWYTNQYTDSNGKWQTRIASFKFPGCNPRMN